MAIGQHFAAKSFFSPVGLLVKNDNLEVRAHKGCLANELPLLGEGWKVLNFVGLRRRARHHQVIADQSLPLVALDYAFVVLLLH